MSGYRENLFYGASNKTFENARALKHNQTLAEKILWEYLRNRKLAGHKFRRQHPVGQFIADFYCHESKLVVELDGSIHDSADSKEYDEGRTYEINELGIKILRIRNGEVEKNIRKVLSLITKHLTPSPSPAGEGNARS